MEEKFLQFESDVEQWRDVWASCSDKSFETFVDVLNSMLPGGLVFDPEFGGIFGPLSALDLSYDDVEDVIDRAWETAK